MRDITGMMKKARGIQEKMQAMQEEMAVMEITATSGGGLVTIIMNGNGNLVSVKIDPTLMKEDDVEILEDLIIAAHNEAKAKVEIAIAEKTQKMTAGLPIPPGFKLPF